MQQILIYGDSLTWGIVPNTRRRLAFDHNAWLSSQGLVAIVRAIRGAPIEKP